MQAFFASLVAVLTATAVQGAPATTSTMSSYTLVTSVTYSPPVQSTATYSPPVQSTAAPFMPPGGADTNATAPAPVYAATSDFDFQSINLALNQEWIELDLFHYGLSRFSKEEFAEYGITPDYQFLIEYMADQEVDHATLLSNILQTNGAKRCTYQYDFNSVPEFINFCQQLTRWGESGVYGFLPHLDSRPSAQLLLQSITTEARQQMAFRQLKGLFPMPVHFEVGIPQAFAWTLLSPYIKSCPASNPHIEFQIFPTLRISNNPDASKNGKKAAVSTNSTSLSHAGQKIYLNWDAPGKITGYDNKYTTNSTAGSAKYAMWINQLNVTYTPLENIKGKSAVTTQPSGFVFEAGKSPIVNGTMFVVITDTNLSVTSYNLSKINEHVVAGPVLFQAD